MIAKNVSLQARLIDDLLDISRISQGKIILESDVVRVHEVLQDAVEIADAEIQKKEHTLTLRLNANDDRIGNDPPAASSAKTQPTNSQLRILLVEDHEGSREALTR